MISHSGFRSGTITCREKVQNKKGKSDDLQMLKLQNSPKIHLILHYAFCISLGELATYTTLILRKG